MLHTVPTMCNSLGITRNTLMKWLKKWSPNMENIKLSGEKANTSDPIILTDEQYKKFVAYFYEKPKRVFCFFYYLGKHRKQMFRHAWQRFTVYLQPRTIRFLRDYGTDFLEALAVLTDEDKKSILANIFEKSVEKL